MGWLKNQRFYKTLKCTLSTVQPSGEELESSWMSQTQRSLFPLKLLSITIPNTTIMIQNIFFVIMQAQMIWWLELLHTHSHTHTHVIQIYEYMEIPILNYTVLHLKFINSRFLAFQSVKQPDFFCFKESQYIEPLNKIIWKYGCISMMFILTPSCSLSSTMPF